MSIKAKFAALRKGKTLVWKGVSNTNIYSVSIANFGDFPSIRRAKGFMKGAVIA